MNSSQSNKIIIFVIVSVLFYVILLIFSDLKIILEQILNFQFEFIPIIFSLMGLQFLFLGLKFHRLLKQLSIEIPVKTSIMIFISGLSLIATPGGMGTAIKSQILKNKFQIPVSTTLPLIYVERFTELLGIIMILAILLIFNIFYQSLLAIMLGSILIFFMYIFSSNSIILKSVRSIFLKIKKIEKFSKNLDESKKSFSLLLKITPFSESLMWSILAKTSQLFAVYFIFLSFNLDLGVILSGQIYYTSLVLGSISFIPSGLIITESTMLQFLTENIDFSLAVTVMVFTRLITTWLGTILGIIFLKITNFQK